MFKRSTRSQFPGCARRRVIRHQQTHSTTPLSTFYSCRIVLDPLPKKATETLKHAAEPLGVEDDVIEIAHKYSKGAYGIAASDTGSKEYMGNPDLVKQGGQLMQRLSRPPFNTFTQKVLHNIHCNSKTFQGLNY